MGGNDVLCQICWKNPMRNLIIKYNQKILMYSHINIKNLLPCI